MINADAEITWDVYIQCDHAIDGKRCPNGDSEYGVLPDDTNEDYGQWDAQEQAIKAFEKNGWQVVRGEMDIPSERKHYCPDHNTQEKRAPKGTK